jgi:hypothetical protein
MVSHNLDLALRGAMQQIRIPLDESDRYLDQLRNKIENQPDIYAINDSNPTTHETLREFFADTTFVGLERSEITSVYQVRRSTLYQHSPGHFVDSLALTNFYPNAEFELLLFINNTIIATFSDNKGIPDIRRNRYAQGFRDAPVAFVTTSSSPAGATHLGAADDWFIR